MGNNEKPGGKLRETRRNQERIGETMRNKENPGEARRNQEQQKGTWINQEKQRGNQKKPGEILGETKSNYEKP